MAGIVGIEPTLTVLETAVLPLYDIPSSQYYKDFDNKQSRKDITFLFRDITT